MLYLAAAAAASAYQSLQGARIGSWLGTNLRSAGTDISKPFREVGRFFKGLFGGRRSSRPTTIEFNQTQVMGDPLMNPNPGVASVFMSGVSSSLNLAHQSFIAYQAGQLNYIASITKGIKTIFTNPGMLFTREAYFGGVTSGLEIIYPHLRASHSNSRIQQAASTGDITNVFYVLGGESANIQIESLSLIPSLRVAKTTGVVGRAARASSNLYPNISSIGAAGNKLYNRLAKIANKAYGAKGKQASQLLQSMANKAGLTVKSGGKHLKVFNSQGHMITTIPHSPHAKGTIKGITEAIMKEAGF